MRRKLDTTIGLAVPADMIDRIDRAADAEMCSRSALMRKAISDHLRKYEAQSPEPAAA
jgi:metal-responsive CopG/Arc/MetJ family transcriptional regulator